MTPVLGPQGARAKEGEKYLLITKTLAYVHLRYIFEVIMFTLRHLAQFGKVEMMRSSVAWDNFGQYRVAPL